MREIICSNCGGKFSEELDRCPFCQFINTPAAQKNYMDSLDRLKDEMVNASESDNEMKEEAKKGLRVFVIILSIVIFVIILLVCLVKWIQMNERSWSSPEEIAYLEVLEQKMDAAYEKGDYDQLARDFIVAEDDGHAMYEYKHYRFAKAYSSYIRMVEYDIPRLDSNELTRMEAGELAYHCFILYYMRYGSDGADVLNEIRENYVLPIMYDRLGFTDEELAQYRGDVVAGDGIMRSKAEIIGMKCYKRFH